MVAQFFTQSIVESIWVSPFSKRCQSSKSPKTRRMHPTCAPKPARSSRQLGSFPASLAPAVQAREKKAPDFLRRIPR